MAAAAYLPPGSLSTGGIYATPSNQQQSSVSPQVLKKKSFAYRSPSVRHFIIFKTDFKYLIAH